MRRAADSVHRSSLARSGSRATPTTPRLKHRQLRRPQTLIAHHGVVEEGGSIVERADSRASNASRRGAVGGSATTPCRSDHSALSMILNGEFCHGCTSSKHTGSGSFGYPKPIEEKNMYQVGTIRAGTRLLRRNGLLLSGGLASEITSEFGSPIRPAYRSMINNQSIFWFGRTRSRHAMLLCRIVRVPLCRKKLANKVVG
jgi:hypothetical protein